MHHDGGAGRMAGRVVETLYEKRHKYEIREVRSWLNSEFAIYRDGARWKGDYDSIARAVEVIKAGR
jgi:hypothetical protein